MATNVKTRKSINSINNTTGKTRYTYVVKNVVSIGITNLASSAQVLWIGIDENESPKFPLAPGESVSLGPDGTGRLWHGQQLRIGFAADPGVGQTNQAVMVVTTETGEELNDC